MEWNSQWPEDEVNLHTQRPAHWRRVKQKTETLTTGLRPFLLSPLFIADSGERLIETKKKREESRVNEPHTEKIEREKTREEQASRATEYFPSSSLSGKVILSIFYIRSIVDDATFNLAQRQKVTLVSFCARLTVQWKFLAQLCDWRDRWMSVEMGKRERERDARVKRQRMFRRENRLTVRSARKRIRQGKWAVLPNWTVMFRGKVSSKNGRKWGSSQNELGRDGGSNLLELIPLDMVDGDDGETVQRRERQKIDWIVVKLKVAKCKVYTSVEGAAWKDSNSIEVRCQWHFTLQMAISVIIWR